jgi:hypothetical protein
MPRKNPVAAAEQRIAAIPAEPLVTLRYSPADMEKLDQFAIGLLGPNSGAGYSNDEIFESRVRAAYLRAEVVLTIRKQIAALEV